MQIGFVKENRMAVIENDERKEVRYLEMFIKPIFGTLQGFTLSKNKSEVTNAPAYNIYAHSEKGWTLRKMKVGALWLKQTDEGESFMSGHIESPLFDGGKLHISLWRARPLFEGEKVEWLYDVNWKHYEAKEDAKAGVPVSVVYPQGWISVMGDDEIPF